jgi:hypothetical protein
MDLKFIEPNEKMLEIVRLCLERLPMMTAKERELYAEVVRRLANPIAFTTRDTETD